MAKVLTSVGLTLFVFFGSASLYPARAQEISAAREKSGTRRILALRERNGAFSRGEIEFMVRVVFADAMNPKHWANAWIRKYHIPAVTHLVIPPVYEGGRPLSFTVLTLPEWTEHHVVVLKGLQGNPLVRRWMSVDALFTYFRKLTTSQGKVRTFRAGFFGLKGIQMGMDLKRLLDDLHARGLMRTKEQPPLSEREKRENYVLKRALSRRFRG